MRIHYSLGRWARPRAAVAAAAATLLLGLVGPALPGARLLAGWGGLGLTLVGSIGMLAWHIARMRVTPAGRSALAGAALPASLLALAVPQLGAAALLMPCALSLLLAWRDPSLRLTALAVQCAAVAMLGAPEVGAAVCLITPALAWLSLRGATIMVANDNPALERLTDIWPLRASQTYGNASRNDSASRIWDLA